MLVQTSHPAQVLQQLAGDPVRGFTIRNFCRTSEGHQPKLLVNDVQDPRVLLAHVGGNFMIYGELPCYRAAMSDLLEGRVEQEGGWPDEETKRGWDENGRRGIFLNTCPYAVFRAALLEGFEPRPEDLTGHVAYMWHWQGTPHFADLVRHPCRLGQGLELLDLLKTGIGYDPEGDYIRWCLEHGPSFVCEVPGNSGVPEPVCWSCTHFNGTLGMIYTPEPLRRHGYARSLSAFQIDYMLARDGIACCHIVDHNTASMSLISGMGAQRWEEAIVWRGVYWPGEAPPPEVKDYH